MWHKTEMTAVWIEHVKEEEATGVVASVYESSKRRGGALDNILKVHSLNPAALRALMSFYNGVMPAFECLGDDFRHPLLRRPRLVVFEVFGK